MQETVHPDYRQGACHHADSNQRNAENAFGKNMRRRPDGYRHCPGVLNEPACNFSSGISAADYQYMLPRIGSGILELRGMDDFPGKSLHALPFRNDGNTRTPRRDNYGSRLKFRPIMAVDDPDVALRVVFDFPDVDSGLNRESAAFRKCFEDAHKFVA